MTHAPADGPASAATPSPHGEIARLQTWAARLARGGASPGAGDVPGPQRLHLVVTRRCNLRCLSCLPDGSSARAEDELDDGALRGVVDEALAMGVEEVYLVGGEVLLRGDLVLDLAARVKDAGAAGDLTTNATHLDARVARRLVELGWDRVQISLDGADAATNDRLRPPAGSFDRALAGLRALARARTELRGGGAIPRLGVTTVVSRLNLDQLPRLADLAAAEGAEELLVQTLRPMSDRCAGLAPTPEQAEDLAAAARETLARCRAHGLATNAGDLTQPSLAPEGPGVARMLRDESRVVDHPFWRLHCPSPWTTVVVHADGRIAPCWDWRGDDLPRVQEERLSAAWRGPLFERWRADLLGGSMPPVCASCCLGFVDHIRWVRLEGLLADDHPRRALALADQILAGQPEHGHAAVARARALLALGRPDEAERWVEHCLDERVTGRRVERAYLVDALRRGMRLVAAARLAPSVLVERGADDEIGAAARRLEASLRDSMERFRAGERW